MKAYTPITDGFQIRDVSYLGGRPKDVSPRFDVVKWYETTNPIAVVDHITGKKEMLSHFCYTVGWLEWDEHEPGFEFRSCGLRWLKADPTPRVVKMLLDFCDEMSEKLTDLD